MIYFGIDVGNYDTKSQSTTIPSGYEGPYKTKPAIASQYLFYRGEYFIPSVDRLYFMKDKTSNERAIVLTLFSIANELIDKAAKKDLTTHDAIQDYISNVTNIGLGVGLPIDHYKKIYIDNLLAYYQEHLGNGAEFIYDDYQFNFKMDICRVYPQGGAASACKANKFYGIYPTYYIIDIGGYTIDVGQFRNGEIAKDRISLSMGIITMYDDIIEKVGMDYDITVDYDIIETVLNNGNTILKPEVITLIKSMSQSHANNIINALCQKKIMFDAHPCLFIGGGSILLKDYILNNSLIDSRKEVTQFLADTRANAKGYARLLRAECKAS